MKIPIVLALIAGVLGIFARAEAAAQTAAFQDWSVTCERTAASAEGRCTMFQQFIRASDGRAVSALFITMSPEGGPPLMSVITPLAVDVKKGVAVKVDGGEQYPVAYLTCRAGGCEAVAGIGEVLLAAMRAGNVFRAAYLPLGQRQQTVPFSLQGFTAAFDALVAESAKGAP